MNGEYIDQDLDHGWRVVEHGDALELHASTDRHLLELDIDIVERFHVVTEKADRRD